MREPLIYEQRQFRNVLYALLLLGFTGYAVAAQTPVLWGLAVSATLLNMWLIYHDAFRPLPRVVANVITLIFAGWMVIYVRTTPEDSAIFAIGQFLTFLQVVKLYEQRGNRDLAQLVVLSLLLTVAAAISTGSLIFGILFICYLFLSLYACLLFHLKTESDHARAVMRNRERPLSMMALRQNQRFISRSMRRLTACVSVFAIGMAVLVFLLFPRNTGAGLIGSLTFTPSKTMTGFNDRVTFQDVANITQNDTPVAYVGVLKNGKPWGGVDLPLLLRGNALDTYFGDPNSPDPWTWKRTTEQIRIYPSISGGNEEPLLSLPPRGDVYTQEIRLLPTGSHTLFAMPGILSFKPARDVRLSYGVTDDVIQLPEQLRSEFNYTITSSGGPVIPSQQSSARQHSDNDATGNGAASPQIRAFALRDEVAGTDANGNLARQRLDRRGVSELDEKLATNFQNYLQRNFTYTLDLTDVRRVADQDPLVQFLYDFKRGHCEYFAGAMTLMCQSLGMEARVVVGFKSYNFNSVGGYYLVKQSDAHAWVEVLTLNGWETFDPTSATTNAQSHKLSLWSQAASVFNFLEYKWGNAVVNYDTDARNSLIGKVDTGLRQTQVTTNSWMQHIRRLFNAENFASVYSGVVNAAIGISVATCVAVVLSFLYGRMRLRRRAKRIGLDALPSVERLRLARQLLFYDELLRSFDRRKVLREPHLTPQEFSRSVGFLPADIYDAVQRLTRIFYRVRYGGAELQNAQQRRLLRVVGQIDSTLNPVQT